jgi:hypothetical protein
MILSQALLCVSTLLNSRPAVVKETLQRYKEVHDVIAI